MKKLILATLFACLPFAAWAEPVTFEADEVGAITIRNGGGLSVQIDSAVIESKGFMPGDPPAADNPPPVDEPPVEEPPVVEEPVDQVVLTFDGPRGEVIFEHHWAEGDVPEVLEQPGGELKRTFIAGGKFRTTKPDGRYLIVTDPETGVPVLDILVTAEDEDRFGTHHTEIDVRIPEHWIGGRFMVPGQRYLLEWWRKNIDYAPDSHWEIQSQNHSMWDSRDEAGRNPAVAIDGGGGGNVQLKIRADSNKTSFRDSNGRWSYSRNEVIDLGPNTSDVWELWQVEIVYHHERGALHIWRNGVQVHSEEGAPVGYNDDVGPPWNFGWYKYFKDPDTKQRQAYFGPVRVQKL